MIGVKKSKDIETSRQVLTNKLKQIEKARTAYDELKEYKIPKKESPCVQKEPNSYEYKFATDSNSNRGYQEGILFSGGNKKNVELENNIKSILSELQ